MAESDPADPRSARADWASRVMERDPELADTLRLFRELFQSRVVRMTHADPDLGWDETAITRKCCE